eukprot:TRINITY_DN15129_c0_g1_i3.p1 TRINITY_DN15129_c0_g1~~TRINITY_DN15129_c0_g1_i3.p1  ORF type:complete len:296 (+),score=76.19 TRINITY_DN15129_c0_g1_i3:412-1299(+)
MPRRQVQDVAGKREGVYHPKAVENYRPYQKPREVQEMEAQVSEALDEAVWDDLCAEAAEGEVDSAAWDELCAEAGVDAPMLTVEDEMDRIDKTIDEAYSQVEQIPLDDVDHPPSPVKVESTTSAPATQSQQDPDASDDEVDPRCEEGGNQEPGEEAPPVDEPCDDARLPGPGQQDQLPVEDAQSQAVPADVEVASEVELVQDGDHQEDMSLIGQGRAQAGEDKTYAAEPAESCAAPTMGDQVVKLDGSEMMGTVAQHDLEDAQPYLVLWEDGTSDWMCEDQVAKCPDHAGDLHQI